MVGERRRAVVVCADHLSRRTASGRPANQRPRAGGGHGPAGVDGPVVTPVPPNPFNPKTATLDVGTRLYRVFTAAEDRSATTFNPGYGSPTRFAFFGAPVIPVLYAAATEEAAVAETLLHDVPVSGGILPYDKYARTVMARLEVVRPIRV